jgi:hypothetical protein
VDFTHPPLPVRLPPKPSKRVRQGVSGLRVNTPPQANRSKSKLIEPSAFYGKGGKAGIICRLT